MATELYQLSAKTVSKVILHATKYAHGEVCGCLLGRQEEHTVIVEDCIPFFHKAENKHSPLLEVALAQSESYAGTLGLKVCGFYQGNELSDDGSLHASTKKVGDSVRDRSAFPRACLLLLDNDAFTTFLSGETADRLPFTLYHKRGPGGSWEGCGRDNVRCQGGLTVRQVREVAAEGVASGKQRDLVDFSEHFCDVAKDWRNEKVVIA